MPPTGAGPVRVTVPVRLPPPRIEFTDKFRPWTHGGLMVRLAEAEFAEVAVIEGVVTEETGVVEIPNDPLD